MKRILTLLLALVLVFSLVACSTSNKETQTETKAESKNETQAEGETKSENLEVTAIAVKGDTVYATAEGAEAKIATLKAGNQTEYRQGHKYSFVLEGAKEISDPIEVAEATMEGRKQALPLDTKLVADLLAKVPEAKIVDSRTAEEVAASGIENAINVPFAEYEKLQEDQEGLAKWAETFADKFTNEDVIVVLGSDPAQNQEIALFLYKALNVPVQFNAGLVSDYQAQ
ncbi:rhodanese-like domain-containing protein [Helcococcus massiliensis]|uniref:rhodanese-like domain-containing protein n=1 Tax=Helcococcus massiliensis TaxID=2040290 RepID=UPI000CDEF9EE|nr:rhodanese-like domain-containing protein [Helcococcus massiliensis]